MTHVYTRERHENKNTHFWATYSLVPGALTDISRDTRGHSFTRVEERRGEMCEKLPPRGVGYADAFPRASRDGVEHQSAGEEAGLPMSGLEPQMSWNHRYRRGWNTGY